MWYHAQYVAGWDLANPDYKVTNENKIATKVSTDQSVLYSRAAQFGPGHSIEFTVCIFVSLFACHIIQFTLCIFVLLFA